VTERPKTPGFLVDVKALSRVFRAKFRDAVKKELPFLFPSIPQQTWKKAGSSLSGVGNS
jgi:hypothetical protein